MTLDFTSHLFRHASYTPGKGYGSPSGAPLSAIGGEAGPETPRPAVERMVEAAELPDDLMGGNRAMRASADQWLPREEEESYGNHDIRVRRSTCFSFYADTVCDLASKPFVKPVEVDGAPSAFDEFMRDVDGKGQDLTVFAQDLMLKAIHRGMYHTLVDSMGSGKTVADTNDRRVYARNIDPTDMLDIRDEADSAGRMHVVYCRFAATRSVNTNSYDQTLETVIIELERGIDEQVGYKVEYKFDTNTGDWVDQGSQPYDPGGVGVPLYTMYANQTGYFEAEPALEDLAWINLAHYQSRADHAHVMRVARLITLVTLGFADAGKKTDPRDKGRTKVALGPLSRINNRNENAKVSFLEPSGRSIELSLEDMAQLEKEANRLGARYHSSGKSHVTAQSVISDGQKLSNNLTGFCVRMEAVLASILASVGEWVNAPATEITVTINKEFDSRHGADDGAKALGALSDVMSPREKLVEGIRYGLLRANFPIEENLAELEAEAKKVADAALAAAEAAKPEVVEPVEEEEPEE
jgi:hypothetical protein